MDGQILRALADWELLPPGDATLTRRVKAAGPTWTIQVKKGRKTFSRGVWAPADRIATIRADLAAERSTDAYAKRRAAETARRDRKQAGYVEDFRGAVLAFLDFAPRYARLAEQLADAVIQHTTPVGSGTVARTQRIPIEKRAESAVIAWLRHATTAYDNMKIPRVKGKRREVRRMLPNSHGCCWRSTAPGMRQTRHARCSRRCQTPATPHRDEGPDYANLGRCRRLS